MNKVIKSIATLVFLILLVFFEYVIYIEWMQKPSLERELTFQEILFWLVWAGGFFY